MIQVFAFCLELFVGATVFDGAFVEGNEMAGPSPQTLKLMGAKYLPCIQDGEIYRFLTPALLHSGILHLFTNMVSQTMIGYTCELHWGTKRMLMFYFGVKSESTLCFLRARDIMRLQVIELSETLRFCGADTVRLSM